MSFAGVEEAGRGPVLGPMVMAILWTQRNEVLRAAGARDSKLLSPQQRERIYRELRQLRTEGHVGFSSVTLQPAEIDAAVLGANDNLNRLEVRTTARLIARALKRERLACIILDSPQKSTEKYAALVAAELERRGVKVPRLVAENKADVNHPVVGAASIIAKVERDRAMKRLQRQLGVPLGSGYPADPVTQQFLRKYYADPAFAAVIRKSWAPYRALVEGSAQRTLSEFGSAERSARERFAVLERHGFSFVATKSPYELVRLRGPGATVILYSTGKLLVQGRAKRETEQLLRRLRLQ